MQSLITLGRRGALLAVVALAVACSSSSSGTSSSGTAGVGTAGVNGSGSTSGGGGCAKLNDSCTEVACCSGQTPLLTCNGSICVNSQSTGTGTGGATTGAFVDPCPTEGYDAGCVSSVQCEAGLLCENGICVIPSPEVPQCAPTGMMPGTGVPCCESTLDAGPAGIECNAWIACLTQGQSCSAGDTCCNGLTCGSDGTCDAVCGGFVANCTQDADCCADQGLSCVKGSMFTNIPPIPGSFCYGVGLPIQQLPTGGSYYCSGEPQCKAYDGGKAGIIDCQLGSTCNSGIPEDGGTDPCAVGGLVCDFNDNVCRNPELFDVCIPGGPSCVDTNNNTTTPLTCSQPLFGATAVSLCTHECQTTEDCVEPWEACLYSQSQGLDATCESAGQVTGCMVASDWLQPCNAASQADGICLVQGGDTQGLCTQAVIDGDGGPGAACSVGGNRQVGGLCDTSDVCMGNLCGQVCNAGTSKTPACGAGLACVPLLADYQIGLAPAPTTDAVTSGACVTPCDITIQDAGTCTEASDQIPSKCYPAEALTYAQGAEPDFCVAAAPAIKALPIGADCGGVVIGNAFDVCVAGAACYAPVLNATQTCMQLCKAPFGVGKGGCPANYTCTAGNYGKTPSTETGVCVPPATDGG